MIKPMHDVAIWGFMKALIKTQAQVLIIYIRLEG